jgi:hypothetical protein
MTGTGNKCPAGVVGVAVCAGVGVAVTVGVDVVVGVGDDVGVRVGVAVGLGVADGVAVNVGSPKAPVPPVIARLASASATRSTSSRTLTATML